MELRIALAPLYAAALSGLCVAAFGYARADTRERWPSWASWTVGFAVVASAVMVASQNMSADWLPFFSLRRIAGVALLVGAAGFALRASRLRSRAELLAANAPLEIDQ